MAIRTTIDWAPKDQTDEETLDRVWSKIEAIVLESHYHATMRDAKVDDFKQVNLTIICEDVKEKK